ncbi:hypothetical protein [Nonomuraea sp. NPDC049400]|uniref:hypothetical protein n=1 Tax=Nonomuraea sp. NPDC049400 TaxID=3364352 RepID=UPI0037B3A940
MVDRVAVQRDADGGDVGAGVVADLQIEDFEQFALELFGGVRELAGQGREPV